MVDCAFIWAKWRESRERIVIGGMANGGGEYKVFQTQVGKTEIVWLLIDSFCVDIYIYIYMYIYIYVCVCISV